jgi:tRNA dimethylallyltransferase
MYNSPKISDSTKNLVNHIYQQGGIDKVRDELKKHDLKSFQKLHPNDHYRNLRALEHWIEHGIPLSQEQERLEKNMPYNFAKNPHGWEITHHYLSIEKSRHWQIIRERVIQMINNGLINEVEHLLSNGFNGNEKPLQSIGYKETISYLKNEIKSQEELLERIYINTRRLAKSQKTFFKKINPKETIHL